jgi:hypothetical protein
MPRAESTVLVHRPRVEEEPVHDTGVSKRWTILALPSRQGTRGTGEYVMSLSTHYHIASARH